LGKTPIKIEAPLYTYRENALTLMNSGRDKVADERWTT
jgi:hypothetical protein